VGENEAMSSRSHIPVLSLKKVRSAQSLFFLFFPLLNLNFNIFHEASFASFEAKREGTSQTAASTGNFSSLGAMFPAPACNPSHFNLFLAFTGLVRAMHDQIYIIRSPRVRNKLP